MKICVVGTGTMGNGIAQTFAQAGHDVLLKGRSEASLGKAHKAIEKSLSKLVEKGKMEVAEKDAINARIKDTMAYEDCKDADLVIEVVAEDMATKNEIFKTLDAICKPEAILATNTSSLSITEIAAATSRPEKVIGMHFFNPVPMMKLVEVIKGQLTSQEVHDKVMAIAAEVGKTPVSVNEAPGFVVNRILIPMVIGLDVCLAIMEVLYNEFGDSKYRPHPLLRKMVRANLLGRKTGIGFYDYRK